MPPSGPGSARLASVESLLRDLGPRLRRAEWPLEVPGRSPTGLAELDRLLGGGFPAGRIGEIAGPASSGRTSLLLRLLAATTAGGESVALVDGANAFDPASASGAGVDLTRTLWARPPAPAEALHAAEILLRAGGFALVTLDLTARIPRPPAAARIPRSPAAARIPRPPAAARIPWLPPTAHWLRLVRAAAASRTALVVLTSHARLVGACADLALELHPLRPRFRGTPALLDGAEMEAALVRHRGGPEGAVRLRLHPAPP